MPRRLNRPTYGHSYTWGKDQRTVSETYKEKYDKIKWDTDMDDWEDGKHHYFGRTKRKKFK